LLVGRGVKIKKIFPQPPRMALRRPGQQVTIRPHKEGLGFSIELKAFSIDGRLVVLPPDGDDNRK
jgi:hypothetical protein